MDVARRGIRRSAIPAPTVGRLPVYHRCLASLAEREAVTVSSAELSILIGVNAATLRRDLSRLGSVGTRGTGYDVKLLLRRVEAALALDRQWPIAIIGVGNLGRALARSHGFNSDGFTVGALVDVHAKVVGTSHNGIVVAHLDDTLEVFRQAQIKIAVITTPAVSAQDVTDRVCNAGVHSILNFAPAVLSPQEGVVIRNVDLSAELQVLAFYGARPLNWVLGKETSSSTPNELAGLRAAR